jgi:hypothetical protein
MNEAKKYFVHESSYIDEKCDFVKGFYQNYW